MTRKQDVGKGRPATGIWRDGVVQGPRLALSALGDVPAGGGGVASSGPLAPERPHPITRNPQIHVRREVLRASQFRPRHVVERGQDGIVI